jgi:uncharacterized tellurite resistance protein B-like protein
MTKLEREHKIAFARIITDLIEADFVVEADEMEFFEKIISKDGFAISTSMLAEAKKMEMEKALSIINGLDDETRLTMVDTLKQLSMSDGVCVPYEAILIFAVEQVLKHNATMHTIPQSGITIDKLKVIYIENEETETGRQIEKNLSSITSELKLAGFDFVYIPSLTRDFRLMEHDYLKKVVKYMIPSISEERVTAICENLRGLTTSRFCRDLLYKKLGMNLIDCKPSLLIKINDSDIVDRYESEAIERTRYSNFLQLELKGDVIDEIHSIIETYHSMISCSITVESKPRTPKFIYTGFHRSLFDLIAFGRELKEYRLFFKVSEHKANVYFESIDSDKEQVCLKLNPQEAALYYMIVQKSLSENGLDWREHIPEREKKQILAEYNKIYSRIGKANSVTEYKDRTQVHHIKNRIRTLRNVANIEMFIPEHYKSGNDSYYRIKANAKFVVFNENTTL